MLPVVLPVVALTGSTVPQFHGSSAPRLHRQVQVEPSDSSECKVVAEGGERRSAGGSDSAEEGGHTTGGGGGWIETHRSLTHWLLLAFISPFKRPQEPTRDSKKKKTFFSSFFGPF